MTKLVFASVATVFLVSCSSNPTRESYCQSLSTETPISEINVFESAEQALKKQKNYCEPDVAIQAENFQKSYASQRAKILKEQCACEVVIFKGYDKGFAVGYNGKQTAEDWAPLCESVGMKMDFDKGVRQADLLKKQMATEFEIIQRLGYSSDQIKDRCKYSETL